MKGSVKSRLNYADIHQSLVVKCFFHKILRLLSAVTNEGSHSPGGQKELEMSPVSQGVRCRARCTFRALAHLPQSSFGSSAPQDRLRERAALQGSNFPGNVLSLATSSCCWELCSQH